MTPNITLFVLVAAIAAAVVAIVLLVQRDRELARIAAKLKQREAASNARVKLNVHSPGLTALAVAVNDMLDAESNRAVARAAEQRAFQEDLSARSHDIRTPLAGAQGYLQLAQRADSASERDRFTNAAIERLASMRSLVDDLFDYAKASDPSLELNLQPTAATCLITDALLTCYPQFAERGWTPTVDTDEADDVVIADADALARIFANLTSNALRHGSDAPHIEMRSLPDGAKRISFANPVADARAIDTDKLFDRFYRKDEARSGEGSGLGLAIVARLAAAMGGRTAARIEKTSDENDVLVIDLVLPATPDGSCAKEPKER